VRRGGPEGNRAICNGIVGLHAGVSASGRQLNLFGANASMPAITMPIAVKLCRIAL
jgi:hypothetical protein